MVRSWSDGIRGESGVRDTRVWIGDARYPAGRELDADGLAAVIDLAAWPHAAWVRIHPFANGNGRGRMEVMAPLRILARAHGCLIVLKDDDIVVVGRGRTREFDYVAMAGARAC